MRHNQLGERKQKGEAHGVQKRTPPMWGTAEHCLPKKKKENNRRRRDEGVRTPKGKSTSSVGKRDPFSNRMMFNVENQTR